MHSAAKRYRIPCRCSATVIVGSGQAGGHVPCPACGGAIDVPRLRDLEAFAVAGDAPVGRSWRPCQAWLMAGAAMAVTAVMAAVIARNLIVGDASPVPDPAAVQAVFDAADAATVHKAWLALRPTGIDRGPSPEDVRYQQLTGLARLVSNLLWAVAAFGGLIAAAAWLVCLFGARGSAPASRPGGGGG